MRVLMVLFSATVLVNTTVASDISELNRSRSEYIKAVNEHDAAKATAAFAPTGDWLSVDGVVSRGKPEIKAAYLSLFQHHPKLTLRLTPTLSRFLSSTVAIEDGKFQFGNGPSRSEGQYIAVQDEGKWLVVSVCNFPQ